MKKLLILRFPLWMSADALEANIKRAKEILGDQFIVLIFTDKVERVEVEIVYDPHFVNKD